MGQTQSHMQPQTQYKVNTRVSAHVPVPASQVINPETSGYSTFNKTSVPVSCFDIKAFNYYKYRIGGC